MQTNIAVITDIHGNSAALKAVFADMENERQVDHIFCLGDLLAIGHETDEVLEDLQLRKNISYVRGNHDEDILRILNGREPGSKGEVREHHYWIAKHMNKRFMPFLSELPMKRKMTIRGKQFLLLHYHLNDQNQFHPIDTNPSLEKLDDLYENESADVVCFGHHHVLHFFKGKDRMYLNPGALGCNSKSIATYALVRVKEDGCIDVEMREVSYDNKEFLRKFYAYDVPAKESILRIFYGDQEIDYE